MAGSSNGDVVIRWPNTTHGGGCSTVRCARTEVCCYGDAATSIAIQGEAHATTRADTARETRGARSGNTWDAIDDACRSYADQGGLRGRESDGVDTDNGNVHDADAVLWRRSRSEHAGHRDDHNSTVVGRMES